jgi:hypothetical protein
MLELFQISNGEGVTRSDLAPAYVDITDAAIMGMTEQGLD